MGAAIYERVLLFGSVGFALLAVSAGCYLACGTGDPHWMNRAGAAIAATEGIIAIAEFHRRARLNKIQATLMSRTMKQTMEGSVTLDAMRANDILEVEIKRAELHVLVIAVLLAMIGEVLHGFGDLLLEAFYCLV